MKILKNRLSVKSSPFIFRTIGKRSMDISKQSEKKELSKQDPITDEKIQEGATTINTKLSDISKKYPALAFSLNEKVQSSLLENNKPSKQEIEELTNDLQKFTESEKKKAESFVGPQIPNEILKKRNDDNPITTKAERLLINPNKSENNNQPIWNDPNVLQNMEKSTELSGLPPDSLRGITMSPQPISKKNEYLYGVLLKNLGEKTLATEVVNRAKGAGFNVGYFQQEDTASIETGADGGYLVRKNKEGNEKGRVKIYDTPSMLEAKEGQSISFEKTPVTKPDYLFGVLNKNFGKKEAMNILNRAERKGFDVDNFQKGAKVSMENGTLIKWDAGGKEKEWAEIYKEGGEVKENSASVGKFSNETGNPVMENGERLSNLSEYSQLIEQYGNLYGIDPALGAGLIHKESSGQCDAVSRAGACGLTQVTDLARKDVNKALKTNYTMADLSDPEISIKVGFKYLSMMLKSFKGEPEQELLALTAYNHGIGNVRKILEKSKRDRVPVSTLIDQIVYTKTGKANTEAREYAKKILAFKEVYAQQGYGPRKSVVAKNIKLKKILKVGPGPKVSHEKHHSHEGLAYDEVFPQLKSMNISIQSTGNDFKNRLNRKATTIEGLMPQTLKGLKILSSYVHGLVISGGTEVGHSGAKTVSEMKRKIKNKSLAGTPTHGGGRKIDFPYSSPQTEKLMTQLNIPKVPVNSFITKRVSGMKMTFHPEKDHLDVKFHA